MKISELIGKPVISLEQSKQEGIVSSAIFDSRLKKILWLTLFNSDETEFVVETASLLYCTEDALVTKFSDQILPRSALALPDNSPMLATTFNTSGKRLGKLTDIELDERLNVKTLYINGEPATKDMVSFSTEVIILEGDKRIKITKSPIKKATQKTRTASIMPITPQPAPNVTQNVYQQMPQQPIMPTQAVLANATEAITNTITATNNEQLTFTGKAPQEYMPQRIIGNYDFLLGRTVADDIKNQRGDIIVEKDTIITASTVETARRYGRLVELTLQSMV